MRNTKFARLLLAAALAAVPARRALAQGADLVGEAGDNTTVERSLCLSIAMAAGAAYECGDLRLAHGLPAVRVLNKVRAPTLVYNSQHASPSPIVSLNYTVPTGTASPVTQVTARVRFHAASGAQRLYTSVYPAWTAGQTRRVAVLVDASTDSTGVYEYDFEILRQHADGSVVATVPASGRLAVVNRKNSPFGAGWWVAGVEALAPRADGSLLWIGGDGSTRLYQPLTDTSWTAPPVDRADTLKRRWVTDASGTPVRRWVRVLPGRAEVRFDSAGRHVETVNALGHRTLFVYSGPRLARIGLPGAAGYSYHFEFASAGGTLSRVLSPTGTGYRYTTVATDAAGRVGRITDPSGDSVRFGYVDATARVRSRTDRRGFTTLYHFDAGARLTTVQVPHADTLAASHAISQESAPLPGVRGALTLDQVFTAHTGYRATEDVTDNSYFFLDRWGAPVRALDPVYHSVRVTRGDARFPALATRTVDETTGRVVRAAYDARGNLATMVDSGTVPTQGVAAVSTYEWDPVWDRVVRATSPEGSVSRTGLDAYGRTAWAQPGNDSTRRTRFEYFATSDAVAPGLARSVKPPLSAAETYGYDAWGNLSTVTGPSGLRVQYRNDAMGRTVATVTPIDRAAGLARTDSVVYDAADRVVESHASAPAVPRPIGHAAYLASQPDTSPAERVTVLTDHDAEGHVTRVRRFSVPDLAGIDTLATRWGYDALGRALWEEAGDGARDSTWYDAAGNAVRTRNRLGQVVTMVYDAANRLTERRVPAVSYALEVDTASVAGGTPDVWFFPRFVDDAGGNLTVDNRVAPRGFTLPGDTARFTWDQLGRLRTARNRDAWIDRRWNLDGTLRADTLRIRTYAGRDSTTHVYGLTYTYDREGRRKTLTHPSQLNPGYPGAWTVSLAYDSITGGLASVEDGYHLSSWTYDAEGRVWETNTAGLVESFAYDAEGRLAQRGDLLPGTAMLHQDVFGYDDRGKTIRVVTLGDSIRNSYSGLGALTRSYTDRLFGETDPEELYTADALGNVTRAVTFHKVETDFQPTIDERVSLYDDAGRLVTAGPTRNAGTELYDPEITRYDAAGNRVYFASLRDGITGTSGNPTGLLERTRNYYDAEGRLRVVDRRTCMYEGTTCHPAPAESRATFEEYRYDPLGRRILTRTDQSWACSANCFDGVTRTVWDGDRVLHEIRAPAAAPEQDNGWAPGTERFKRLYGRVAYTFGAGLDQPLVIYRAYYDTLFTTPGFEGTPGHTVVLLPRTTWRGDYDMGLFANVGPTHSLATGVPAWCREVPLEPYDQEPVGGTNPGTGTIPTTHVCANVSWPAQHLWMTHRLRPGAPAGSDSWWGSLIENKRDLTGQLYMRNRYYDPQAGRFTQEDPIGLAGGLNVYGFAAGDPVSYSDPYGLCPQCGKSEAVLMLESAGYYSTRDAAAKVALQQAYPPSIQVTPAAPNGLEYGGELIAEPVGPNGSNVYRFTAPRTDGSEAGFNPNTNLPGFDGAYHSHGANSHGRYDDENFSERGDKTWSDSHRVPLYLVTPSGVMQRYDPDPNSNRAGAVTVIGRISP